MTDYTFHATNNGGFIRFYHNIKTLGRLKSKEINGSIKYKFW